ncbi:unnamed protein product, partial [Callosobruchus maculatus]
KHRLKKTFRHLKFCKRNVGNANYFALLLPSVKKKVPSIAVAAALRELHTVVLRRQLRRLYSLVRLVVELTFTVKTTGA